MKSRIAAAMLLALSLLPVLSCKDEAAAKPGGAGGTGFWVDVFPACPVIESGALMPLSAIQSISRCQRSQSQKGIE